MSNTKIVVLKRRQLLYTGIAVAAGIVLLLCLILSGSKKDSGGPSPSNTPQDEACYQAGVYTSVISLNDTLLNLEVVVDKNHINSIRIINLDESITTMYPLVKPALDSIAAQLISGTAPSDVTLSEESKYTQTLLLNAINNTLEKAALSK